MRTLMAIVTLMYVSPAVPGGISSVEASEPACGAEAAAYIATAASATARGDLLFCLLGDAATSDIVAFGEEGGAHYKAYASTRRVRYVFGGSVETGIGGWSGSGRTLYGDCPPTPPVARLVDDGGTMKMEGGLFAFSMSSWTETIAENKSVRDLFASEWQVPLTVDLGMARAESEPGRILSYVWARANADAAATATGGTGCPTEKKVVLVPTGGQYWNIADPWRYQYGRMVEMPIIQREFME